MDADFAQMAESASSREGIEANDLAGLLTQFEEATSSVDDMVVPSASYKRKRSVLMKAKSCGNSPAVTPPATPPPFFPRQNICLKTQPVRQKSLLVKNPADPLQFTIVVPSSIVQAQKTVVPSSVSMPSTTLSSHHPTPSTALIVTPKSLLQNTQATKLAVHTNPSLTVLTKPTCQLKEAKQLHNPSSSNVLIKPGMPDGIQNISTVPVLLAPAAVSAGLGQQLKLNHVTTSQQQSGAATLGKTVILTPSSSSPFQAQQRSSVVKPTANLLNMPIIDSSIPQKRKITIAQYAQKNKSVLPRIASASAQTKTVTPTVSSGTSTVSSAVLLPAKTAEKPPVSTAGLTEGLSLLQSMLTNYSTSLMNSKLTSTSVFSQKKLPLTQTKSSDSKTQPGISSSLVKAGLPAMVPVLKAPTSHSHSNNAIVSPPQSSKTAVSQDCEASVGEHAYCSSPATSRPSAVPKEGLQSFQSHWNVEVSKAALVTTTEQKSSKTESIEEGKLSVKDSHSEFRPIDEFVFEEGEVQVDVQGNNILNPHVDSSPTMESDLVEDVSSTRAVSFSRSNAPSSSRRGRRYRRRAELSNSPIREDTSNFFDKIPSHYTVLSIAKKPTKTTAFESTTKALGSMDHLDMSKAPEVPVAQGHYDKVPAYRSIFTNTTKELNVSTEPETHESGDLEKEAQTRSHRSSSQHSYRSRSSHRSYRSGSRNSSGARSMHSVSRSPDSRRGRSRSRSGRSRRSCSQSSSGSSRSGSSSSGSYCSTCGASLSRSRSRSGSFSSDGSGDRSMSRSRSRSPRQDRDRDMRRRRRIRSYTPDNRGYRSRSRSHSRSPSRSYSPARQRAIRLGRSQRHRTRSRSSAERRIMERRKEREDEKVRAMEERRVVYVGKIPEGYTKYQLKKRFERFGDIKAVKINFREHGDNYGFITYTYACDAIAAKEKGNNIPGEQRFDLCFGGRRHFCPDQYADLDGNREIEEEYAPMPKKLNEELDYAALLRQHQSQQRKKR